MLSNTKSVDHREKQGGREETDSYLTTSFNELFFNPTQRQEEEMSSCERRKRGQERRCSFPTVTRKVVQIIIIRVPK